MLSWEAKWKPPLSNHSLCSQYSLAFSWNMTRLPWGGLHHGPPIAPFIVEKSGRAWGETGWCSQWLHPDGNWHPASYGKKVLKGPFNFFHIEERKVVATAWASERPGKGQGKARDRPERPRGSPGKPRETQRGPGGPRDVQGPREAQDAQGGPKRPREAQ